MIKVDAHPKAKTKQTIHFRDLLKCVYDSVEYSTDQGCKWSHVFVLFTRQRPYRLYAFTLHDKQKWIYYLQAVINKVYDESSTTNKTKNPTAEESIKR